MLTSVVEVLGWTGALASFTAYLLFSLNRIPNGHALQAAFLLGGLCMALNGFYHSAWPSAITNLAWCTIAALTLIRLVRSRPFVPAPPQDYPHHPLPLPTADTTPPACSQAITDNDGAGMEVVVHTPHPGTDIPAGGTPKGGTAVSCAGGSARPQA